MVMTDKPVLVPTDAFVGEKWDRTLEKQTDKEVGEPFRRASDVCSICNAFDDELRATRSAIRNRIRINDKKGRLLWDKLLPVTILGELLHAGYKVFPMPRKSFFDRPKGVVISWVEDDGVHWEGT